MLFVDGNDTGIQLGDTLGIDIRANYVVSRFRETRGSHQSHITTPDYANMQSETPVEQNGQRGDCAPNKLTISSQKCAEEGRCEMFNCLTQRRIERLPLYLATSFGLRISLAHQQSAQAQKDQLRLAANDVPK